MLSLVEFGHDRESHYTHRRMVDTSSLVLYIFLFFGILLYWHWDDDSPPVISSTTRSHSLRLPAPLYIRAVPYNLLMLGTTSSKVTAT